MLAIVVLGVVLAASAAAAATRGATYTRAGTLACLSRHTGSVDGLPPATPPKPVALFVDALSRDVLVTEGATKPRPAHTQLGAWSGPAPHGYNGIILSFFSGASDARTAYTSFSGNKLVRNVVVTWDTYPSTKPSAASREPSSVV